MRARVVNGGIALEWRDLDGDRFELFRSTHETGDYEFLASTEGWHYRDDTANLWQADVRYHYKLRAHVGAEWTEHGPFTHRAGTHDRIALKIMQEYEVLLRVMRNPTMKLLAKRREAKKCPDCWNPITRKVRFSNCTRCDGTGELSGYHRPVELKVSREVSSYLSSIVPEDIDKVTLTPISGWAAASPSLMNDDVLIDRDGVRYLVQNVTPRTKGQAVIRYMFQASPLEKGHPAYLAEEGEWSE